MNGKEEGIIVVVALHHSTSALDIFHDPVHIELFTMQLNDLIEHLETLVPIVKAVPILGSRVEGSLETAIKIAEAAEAGTHLTALLMTLMS
jgi:hypothetical protein